MAGPLVSDVVSGQNSTTFHREQLASLRNQIQGQKEKRKTKRGASRGLERLKRHHQL